MIEYILILCNEIDIIARKDLHSDVEYFLYFRTNFIASIYKNKFTIYPWNFNKPKYVNISYDNLFNRMEICKELSEIVKNTPLAINNT